MAGELLKIKKNRSGGRRAQADAAEMQYLD